MALNRKRVWCDFYCCDVIHSRPNMPVRTMEQIFDSYLQNDQGAGVVKKIGGRDCEMCDVTRTDTGYEGLILKYKNSDLPHAGVPGTAQALERELDLLENEQLIEKAYFAFHSDFNLLILQRNRMAINSEQMGDYLTSEGYTVSLNPILETADLQRFMRDEIRIRTAELIIANPTNPELFQNIEHEFSNSIIRSLASSGTAKLNFTLRGDGHSRRPESRYLDNGLKRALLELTEKLDVQKADLTLEDDQVIGVEHPVDLVADRLRYSETIQYDGRYIPRAQILTVLRNARECAEPELISYFGARNERGLQ